MLTGFARALKRRRIVHLGWLTPMAGIFVMLDLTGFWESSWASRGFVSPQYGYLLIGLFVCGLYYLAASVIFPSEFGERADFDAHYQQHRQQVFGAIAICDLIQMGPVLIIRASEIPTFTTPEGVRVRVLAGASHGVEGAVQRDVTQPLYLDLEMPAGATFVQPLPSSRNAFVYVFRGELGVGETDVTAQRMAILANEGDGIVLRARAGTRALLIAGEPLHEPIAQYGPFVMNTQDELVQAVRDYQSGKFAA